MKRIAIFFIEKIVFGLLCAIVPAEKGLLLFGSGFGRFSDNPKYLFLHFQDHRRYKPIWISSNREEVRQLREKGYHCKYRWSFSAFWAVVRAPIFFISHNVSDIYPVVPRRGTVINLWHGTPIKQIGFDSLKERVWIEYAIQSGRRLPYERWDYFIAASPNTVFIFEGAMRLPRSKIVPLGQPRTEYIHSFMNNGELKTTLGSKLPLPRPIEKCTTVLYTPTFRNNDAATLRIKQALIEIDNALQEKEDTVILFKPHPLDSSTFDDSFFSSLKNVINVSSEDTQDLLCTGDVLITDYSSILFDFMITGRPIIAYVFDKESYISENGGLYFSFEELQAKVANTEEELIDLIQQAKNLKGDYDSTKFNLLQSNKKIESFISELQL